MIKITGSVISQFMHCNREWWLFYHWLKTEDENQKVQIWKYYHETRQQKTKNSEIELENIKIDQIEWDYVIEFKKAKTHPASAKYQLLFYLYELKKKWIDKKWKIIFKENKWGFEVILDEASEKDLLEMIEKIKNILDQPVPPPRLWKISPAKECKWCSYLELCYI